MTGWYPDRVPGHAIEKIVGVSRHPTEHYGRMVDDTVFILHSQECLDSGVDIVHDCEFSLTLASFRRQVTNMEGQVRMEAWHQLITDGWGDLSQPSVLPKESGT